MPSIVVSNSSAAPSLLLCSTVGGLPESDHGCALGDACLSRSLSREDACLSLADSPFEFRRFGRPGFRLGAKRHAMPECVQVVHALSPGGIMQRIFLLWQVSSRHSSL